MTPASTIEKLIGRLGEVTPNIGASTDEPSLRVLVELYYARYFDPERAQEQASAYFAALQAHLQQEGR